ncbi:mannose-1-phosphate guanylyltransferase/mannose-6-phosphate isomerase [Thiolapillus sp.]
MVPVILSGGSGTRLWPVSRKTHPKQFWPLLSEHSMLQETCNRLENHKDMQAPIVVCNEDHRFFVAHQLQTSTLGNPAIILEPMGKNTAPAVAAAAFQALKNAAQDEDPVLLVLPADHAIKDIDAFHTALAKAERLARTGHLVTFGIVPTAAETGYGYIQGGKHLDEAPEAMQIKRFVEKPDQETAKRYLDSGEYFWNSGMFVFQASTYLNALEQFVPEMLAATRQAWEQSQTDADFIRLDKNAFASCPSDSIDYAVMEHTDSGIVIPLDAGWSDVGSWSALWEIGDKDENVNVIVGDVLAQDSTGCYLRSDNRLLATLGIEDIMVVDTHDVVLVAHKSQVQKVKDLVNQLSKEQRQEINIHALVHRPWGSYQGIDRAERYQVKRISVAPGASLSLQMHHHRAEHWIVVKGTAKVTRGDETFILSENQSTYIPIGELHRLENPGKIPLEIIEVQSGSYLGEDDIERLDDIYGRQENRK